LFAQIVVDQEGGDKPRINLIFQRTDTAWSLALESGLLVTQLKSQKI
tara:strand:+ start:516 stop:656 length:141 start_codon:yes stop_codon:yes gene_type:complete